VTLETAWRLVVVFGTSSLLSFGGGNAIVPDLQRRTVALHWVTAQQFADSFALSQVAPGPSSLLVTLLGYRAAGWDGALLATAAMILPAAILVYVTARLWHAGDRARWRAALERGLAPIAVGLVATSGIVVARSVDQSGLQLAISLAAGVLLGTTKLNPAIVVLGGGALALLVNWS